jgi:NAD(P)-dependent dehydrogenase (short-subunit alcohol dehydrogenase family)
MAKNVVIVGANRGIGLELVRAYKHLGDRVVAVCRKASEDLKKEGVEIRDGIDIQKDSSISQLAEGVELEKVDVLIHNAGILRADHYPDIDLDTMREQFEVNTLGPLKSVMALRDKLLNGSKVGLVTSRVGSIEDNSSSNNYGYRTSKAALNMIGKCLSLDLKNQGVAVALLHPGFVRTEMTAGNGLLDADEAASGLVQRMEELDLNNTGLFVHSNGEKLPW